jgi:hypothetical protein
MFQAAGVGGEVESVQVIVYTLQILPGGVVMTVNERDLMKNLPDFA